jgi:Mrp family chromosome partitioning ATPase
MTEVKAFQQKGLEKLQDIKESFDMRERKIDLPSVEAAAFDSHADEHAAKCLPGTREELLHGIRKWAQDPQGKCILWLNGMAGTGKSTISQTVAQAFANDGQPVASFFKREVRGNVVMPLGFSLRLFFTLCVGCLH